MRAASARSARSRGRGKYGPDGELEDLAASNFIFGRANIDGRPVVASADDFTVRGGAADAALHRKFVQCEAMAHEYRLLLIRMIDGTGRRRVGQDAGRYGLHLYPARPGLA